MFNLSNDSTKYKKINCDFVKTDVFNNKEFLIVNPLALEKLTEEAFNNISHYLRSSHLEALAKVANDEKASINDKYVANELIENAILAAEGIFPTCQDTGTALVYATKGQYVLTYENDYNYIEKGIFNAYKNLNLRYSMNAPLSMYEEKNTGTNLPAEIEIKTNNSNEYNFLFMAKGGGSSNKTFLFQETRALLSPEKLRLFLNEKLKSLGTSACPPYHIGIAIGGTSPDLCLKTAKLASAHYYDELPKNGNEKGDAFRDLETEKMVEEIATKLGFGAQFGGKHFCLDARVIRLSRHGASLPVAIAVSCVADRQIKAKINKNGVFIEELENKPKAYLPLNKPLNSGVKINLNQPINQVLKELSKQPVGSMLLLSGTMIVARDIAHAKIKERIDKGEPIPDYLKNHPIYYAGPAKKPEGCPCGSLGPTTAGRMDDYTEQFQSLGASLIMLAKGNRSSKVLQSCKKHGGFYLGTIGGAAATAACRIKDIELIEFPELGMEAIWRINVCDFPAFILIDDKGNDFYENVLI